MANSPNVEQKMSPEIWGLWLGNFTIKIVTRNKLKKINLQGQIDVEFENERGDRKLVEYVRKVLWRKKHSRSHSQMT